MAFAAVPMVAVGVMAAAAAAGAGVGGTALGIALSTRDKMRHTTTVVHQLLNLSAGDHISIKSRRSALAFRHAIVVEPPSSGAEKTTVVYHCGSRGTARVKCEQVDLLDAAAKGDVLRHQYEQLISYPQPAVVARAVSLSAEHNSAERREVLRSYWRFFRDDEHFADWCQIGCTFSDGMRAMLVPSDYTETPISDLLSLNEGDHVRTASGVSGIVVGVGEKMSQLELARFPAEDRRGPGSLIINDVDRLFRCDYDLAVGVGGQTAKEAALRESTMPSEPMPYADAEQFAVWCRTSSVVHPRVASALARARVLGRVWAWVQSVDELRCGDHIAYNSGAVYYYQHAIVSSIDGTQAGLILQVGNVSEPPERVVKTEFIDVARYIRKEQLCRYFYDVREWYDPDSVVSRASSVLGMTADKLPFKDPQHFAGWSKTGSYQLHR